MTKDELNEADMEFLLKTLVAGKLSGIPVEADQSYLDLIKQKFPEVLGHIEQISLMDKQDVRDLVEEKTSRSLSQLVDIFSGRFNEPNNRL